MSIAGRITKGVASRLRQASTWLLPRDCLLCAGPSGVAQLCPGCAASLPRLPRERCPVCALPTPGAAVCGACLVHPPHFDATHAVFRYEFPVDRLIQELKYGHRLAGADFLARELAALPLSHRPDLILPVPLAPARLAGRGFNQAVELARPLARALGVPLDLRGVSRERDTASQAALPWTARTQNLRHAFACRIDLTGKTVLVVDDVMTSGATLNELARTLRAAGAARVENLIAARTLKT